jgi:[ribosomal protein S5]-alanine N-acetyltransferase
MEITTSRLLIREYLPTDFPAFFNLVSDPVIRRFSVLKTRRDEASAKTEFDAILGEQSLTDRKRFILAVVTNPLDHYIADVGFEILKHNATGGIAEIGYFIAQEYWGRGYGTEIAKALIGYCFTALPMHKVVASCDKRNSASEKIMINCGMKKEGEFLKNRYQSDEWQDELKYGILKAAWLDYLAPARSGNTSDI